jgi:hypothetical protein
MNEYVRILITALIAVPFWYGVAKWYLKRMREYILDFYRKAAIEGTLEHQIVSAGQQAAFAASKGVIGDHVKNVIQGWFARAQQQLEENYSSLEEQGEEQAQAEMIRLDPQAFITSKLLKKNPELAEIFQYVKLLSSQNHGKRWSPGGGGDGQRYFEP